MGSNKRINKIDESLLMIKEIDLEDFDFWSGAKDTVKYLTVDELGTLTDALSDMYSEGMTETEINDFFWFEDDTIAEMLGYDSFEELMEREDVNESLKKGKPLNEGPGAGYTVSGTLTNVKVNAIKNIKEVERTDLVEYEVDIDATANFEGVSANSYYYGGTIESTPVSIERVRVEFSDGEDLTTDDIRWAIDGTKVDASLGGGWSHSKFDGIIDVDYRSLDNTSLTAVLFELVDERAITYLDKAVQNENAETQYGVVEGHWIEASFDTEEEAIQYAKDNGYEAVQELHVLIDINGDEIDTEFGDIVWTNGFEESLTESLTDEELVDMAKFLQKFFAKQKMDDITLEVKKGHLCAFDDDGNKWRDASLYDFIVNEVLAFDKGGNLSSGLGAAEPFVDRIKDDASKFGVTITPIYESLKPEYVKALKDKVNFCYSKEDLEEQGADLTDMSDKDIQRVLDGKVTDEDVEKMFGGYSFVPGDFGLDESLNESYVEVDTIECGEEVYKVVYGGVDFSKEKLVPVEDKDGNRTKLYFSDMVEFYTWYDKKGNVIHEPSDMDESLREDIYDDIQKETTDGLSNGSVKEMSNVIFDTLFNNTQYPQFDFDTVENPEVDANRGQIVFDYMGHEYKITIEEVSGHFAESIEKSLTESVDEEDRINALADYLNIDPSEISNLYDYEYETPEGDYLVLTESEAREAAEDSIRNIFDDIGMDSFSKDFQEWIKYNALDEEWFEDAVKESYEAYVEDIAYEEGRLEDELIDAGIISEGEDYDEEDAKQQYVEYLVEQAGDPIEHCKFNFGEEFIDSAIKGHNLINLDKVIDECIDVDGIAHFIALYDGDEIELGDGYFAYRTN